MVLVVLIIGFSSPRDTAMPISIGSRHSLRVPHCRVIHMINTAMSPPPHRPCKANTLSLSISLALTLTTSLLGNRICMRPTTSNTYTTIQTIDDKGNTYRWRSLGNGTLGRRSHRSRLGGERSKRGCGLIDGTSYRRRRRLRGVLSGIDGGNEGGDNGDG